jgi:hypothetical protein
MPVLSLSASRPLHIAVCLEEAAALPPTFC